ncbi:MAG: hypothetical protein HY582_01315 [Candidatus Omnitrophica bacterium]|nr:hypothetical protein [Candidatus Omnitrophota bacterium]
MTKEHLTEELENILKKTRLKTPPESLMSGYLSNVTAKINIASRTRHISHFLQVGFVILLFVSLGFGVWYFAYWLKPTVSSQSTLVPQVSTYKQEISKPDSLREEMEILSSFDSEWWEGADPLLQEGEDLLEEALLLDELELSSAHRQTPLTPAAR